MLYAPAPWNVINSSVQEENQNNKQKTPKKFYFKGSFAGIPAFLGYFDGVLPTFFTIKILFYILQEVKDL